MKSYFFLALIFLSSCERQSSSEKKANAEIEKLNKTWVVNSIIYDAGIPDSLKLKKLPFEIYFGDCNYMDNALSLYCGGQYVYDTVPLILTYQYQFESNLFLLRFEKGESPFSTPITSTTAQKIENEKVINLMNGNWRLAIDGETLTGEMKSSINNNGGLVKFSAKRK